MNQLNENNQGADLSGMYKVPDNDTKTTGQQTRPARSSLYKTPWIIRLVIKLSGGLVKNESQAGYVLLGFVVVFLITAIILFFNTFSGPSGPPAGYEGNIPDLPEYRNPPTPEDFR